MISRRWVNKAVSSFRSNVIWVPNKESHIIACFPQTDHHDEKMMGYDVVDHYISGHVGSPDQPKHHTIPSTRICPNLANITSVEYKLI